MTTAVIKVIIIPIEENSIPLALPGVLLTGSVVVPLVKGVSVVPLVTVASVVVLLVTVASVVVLLITGASVVVLLITGSSVVVLLVIGASVVVLLGATVGDAVSFNTWIFQPRFKWVAHYS